MGISLGGSSDAYRPRDDDRILGNVKVITAHDAIVYGDEIVPGNHNLLVGHNIVSGSKANKNIVLGENVTVADGVENAVSLGRRNAVVSESGAFQVGDFLSFQSLTGDLNVAGDLIRGNMRTGNLALGKADEVRIDSNRTSVSSPLQIRSKVRTGQEWEFSLEPSLDDPLARDMVLRATDGTAVVFCSGSAQAI